MGPFSLFSTTGVLNQPGSADVDDIARYCADPVCQRFLSTPWPYERAHAESFVEQFVPEGWRSNTEWTWAIRERSDGPLLGIAAVRLGSGSVGFWLGAPHRGRGHMHAALSAIIDAVFARTELAEVTWEATIGNVASLHTAQRAGFRYLGEGPGTIPDRDGHPVNSWIGTLGRDDDRSVQQGWPDTTEWEAPL